jgi:hypothetical protein
MKRDAISALLTTSQPGSDRLGRMGTIGDIVRGVLYLEPRHLPPVSSSTLTAAKMVAINTNRATALDMSGPEVGSPVYSLKSLLRQAHH